MEILSRLSDLDRVLVKNENGLGEGGHYCITQKDHFSFLDKTHYFGIRSANYDLFFYQKDFNSHAPVVGADALVPTLKN